MVSPPTTKGWTPDWLVALGSRMKHMPRVSAVKDRARLDEIIKEYEASGVPLIIEDWEKTPLWPGDKLFGMEWLLEHGDEMIAVRDCVTRRDKEIMFKEFIEKSRAIPKYAQEDEPERLYGKDAVCPKEWREWLMNSAIPEVLKPGSSEDVLELLPERERVETLMCYYGIGDTFTAAHKDLCASSGHNLMCSVERGGSAFWFMTRSSDAPRAAAYFKKLGAELDHELHAATPEEFAKAPFTVYVAEQHVGDLVLVPRRSCHQVVNNGGITAKMSWSRMTVDGLCTAFHHELPVYRRVCRSETYRVKLLIYRALVKYSEDLEKEQQQFAATVPHEVLSRGRRFPRTSQRSSSLTPPSSPYSQPTELPPCTPNDDDDVEMDALLLLTLEHENLIARVRTLLSVYDKILKEEHHGGTQCELRIRRSAPAQETSDVPIVPSNSGSPLMPIPSQLYHDGLTCDFCGADIFLSFFECRRCVGPNIHEDSIVVCPSCYVEGRSCVCEIMSPVQQYPMDVLLEVQHKAQKLLNFDGYGRHEVKVVALSHQAIDKLVDHPGIFAAACQILRIRVRNFRKEKSTASCRKGRSGDDRKKSHIIPIAGALSCRKCHDARCFEHILANGYHVADALKIYLRDATHEKWHTHHKNGAQRLAAKEPLVLQAEEAGEPCDMSVSLVLHAQNFKFCRPMSARVKVGWYDGAADLDIEEDTEYESDVQGFRGHVLGESEEDLKEDVIEITSDDSSDFHPPTRKRRPLIIRLNMKSIQKPPPRQPRLVPYVLVPMLTLEEREKYYTKQPQIPVPLSQSAPVPNTHPAPFVGSSCSVRHSISIVSDNVHVPVFFHPLSAAGTRKKRLLLPPPSSERPMIVAQNRASTSTLQASTQPNRIIVRTPKGSPKKPPGTRANEMPVRVRHRLLDDTLDNSSSDDAGAVLDPKRDDPHIKIGHPSKTSQIKDPQVKLGPRRAQRKPRRQLIRPDSPDSPPFIHELPTDSADCAEKRTGGSRPADTGNVCELGGLENGGSKFVFPLNSALQESPSSRQRKKRTSKFQKVNQKGKWLPPRSLEPPNPPMQELHAGTGSASSAMLAAGPPNLTETMLSLELGRRETQKKNEELTLEVKWLREELAEAKAEPEKLRKELEETRKEMMHMKADYMQLRQRLNAPPIVASSSRSHGANWSQAHLDCTQNQTNVKQPVLNDRKVVPVIRHSPSEKGKDRPVQGVNTLLAHLHPEPRQQVTSSHVDVPTAELGPTDNARTRRKRTLDDAMSGPYSTPLQRDNVSNVIESQSPESVSKLLRIETPETPSRRHNRPLRPNMRRASLSNLKRRKCTDDDDDDDVPLARLLKTPQRSGIREEPYLPEEVANLNPITPVNATASHSRVILVPDSASPFSDEL